MQQNETASAANISNAQLKLTTVTALAAAYLSHNHVTMTDIPAVFSTFSTQVDLILSPTPVVEPSPEPQANVPFVSVKKSVQPDYIVSLFDGRKFKSLKRYLRTTHDMSPEQYRAHFNLPRDYPIVAPNYAKARSDLAKQMGLGQGGRIARAAAASKPEAKPSETPAASAAKAPKASVKTEAKTSTTKAASAAKPKAAKATTKASAVQKAPKTTKAKAAADTQAPATEGTSTAA